MKSLTSHEVRASLRNASPREISTLALPRGFDSLRFDRLDYLGWRDPRARHRGYLFTQTERGPVGLILTAAAQTAGTRNRAVMCGLCQVPQRFDQVSLFTAPTSSIRSGKGFGNGVGAYLCSELNCVDLVWQTPVSGPLDPPAEEIIARRREALRQRARRFVGEVLGESLAA